MQKCAPNGLKMHSWRWAAPASAFALVAAHTLTPPQPLRLNPPTMFAPVPSSEELRLDEEIRVLEMKKNRISQQHQHQHGNRMPTTPPSYYQELPQYPGYASFQPPISFNPYQYQQPGPFMMLPPQPLGPPQSQQQQQQQSQQPGGEWTPYPPMFQPPSYPQGYFIPPYMGPPAPYAYPPQQSQFAQPQLPPSQAFDASVSAAAADLDKLKQFAADNNKPQQANLGAAVSNALVFGAQMVGSSALVMVRDLFDTTKERAEPNKLTVQHLHQLEEEAVAEAMEHIESRTPAPLNEKQKIKKQKSVRQLLKAKSVNEVVMGLKNSGREDEAEALAKRVLALRRQMYGDTHEATAHALNQLASVLARQSKWQEAEDTFASALGVLRLAFQIPNHSSTLVRSSAKIAMHEVQVMHNLAAIKLKQQGQSEKQAEALALGLELVEICQVNLGDSHPKTVHYKRMWVAGFHASNPVVVASNSSD
ncbi:hypothetical protein BASA81_002029 [Batrachochytrium salamandrivorans]|nr:hypothetical protein BASA81_002029 [Batrachochytrium salamandrivorans]